MLDVAISLSERGTCRKKQVGCVLVDTYGNIIATGYNGQPRGMPHCDIINPCPAYLDANLSCHAIHAEANALIRCPDVERIYTIYVTEKPCGKCLLLIKNTACKQIIYQDEMGLVKVVAL
jgi:dCMP deaminase